VASETADPPIETPQIDPPIDTAQADARSAPVTRRERTILLASVLVISVCALVYELVVGTLSSYLLGDSVTQFSVTIGLFLFAMGLGATLSRRILRSELAAFIVVEILTGLFGGSAAAVLYATYSLSPDSYRLVMIGVIGSIGICVGLEIPLLTRIVAARADLANALADVLTIDYVGALIGSLAFPLLLLPWLGVNQTGFLVGLFNVVVAGSVLFTFRHRLAAATRRALNVAVASTALLMVAGLLASTWWVNVFEQRMYDGLIVFREQTSYQRLVITKDQQDLRFFLDGNLQFSSRDEYRYHEMLVHPVASAAKSRSRVLVLGGGDGMAVRELLKYPDVERVTVVDLDPAVITMARTYAPVRLLNQDSFAAPRVQVLNQDAFTFVQRDANQYSVIIADLPDPNNESLSKLYSRQFYMLLAKHLEPGGAFVTQATSPYFVREAFWTVAHTLDDAGWQTLPLRTQVPSFGEWGFVLATRGQPPSPHIPQGIDLRYLTPDVLDAARIFDPDTSEVPTGINTLDSPVLQRSYLKGYQAWD
jgi:spermidine synthase